MSHTYQLRLQLSERALLGVNVTMSVGTKACRRLRTHLINLQGGYKSSRTLSCGNLSINTHYFTRAFGTQIWVPFDSQYCVQCSFPPYTIYLPNPSKSSWSFTHSSLGVMTFLIGGAGDQGGDVSFGFHTARFGFKLPSRHFIIATRRWGWSIRRFRSSVDG